MYVCTYTMCTRYMRACNTGPDTPWCRPYQRGHGRRRAHTYTGAHTQATHTHTPQHATYTGTHFERAFDSRLGRLCTHMHPCTHTKLIGSQKLVLLGVCAKPRWTLMHSLTQSMHDSHVHTYTRAHWHACAERTHTHTHIHIYIQQSHD